MRLALSTYASHDNMSFYHATIITSTDTCTSPGETSRSSHHFYLLPLSYFCFPARDASCLAAFPTLAFFLVTLFPNHDYRSFSSSVAQYTLHDRAAGCTSPASFPRPISSFHNPTLSSGKCKNTAEPWCSTTAMQSSAQISLQDPTCILKLKKIN